jgi:hypothetical protein
MRLTLNIIRMKIVDLLKSKKISIDYEDLNLEELEPLTLQGAGLFHMAMGAILGIAAYGRTQEKLNDKAGSTLPAPAFTPAPSTAPAFGNAPLGGNTMSTAPSFGTPTTKATPTPAFGAPVQPPHPEI